MARIEVEIAEVTLQGDRGPCDGVVANCTRCGHQTESFGTSDRSRRRCLVLMREECPAGEHNFYVAADDAEEPE